MGRVPDVTVSVTICYTSEPTVIFACLVDHSQIIFSSGSYEWP